MKIEKNIKVNEGKFFFLWVSIQVINCCICVVVYVRKIHQCVREKKNSTIWKSVLSQKKRKILGKMSQFIYFSCFLERWSLFRTNAFLIDFFFRKFSIWRFGKLNFWMGKIAFLLLCKKIYFCCCYFFEKEKTFLYNFSWIFFFSLCV